ncbi:MAG: hypothetical protein ACFFAT_02820 [Promethearchaeota archaeon]
MKVIHIFDIDGCILPSVFFNIQYNDILKEEIIKEVINRSRNVVLFPEFINYYSQNCVNGSMNIFLTGRKERAFNQLTQTQLFPLKIISPFKIIYYPEEKSYLSKEYFNWKTKKIQNLFIENKSYNNDNQVEYIIYDDMIEHFNSIKKLAKSLNINISLKPIKTSNDWIL